MSFVLRVDDDLSLRLVEPRHAEEIFAVVDANRAHLRPWLPWVDPTTDASVTRKWAEGALRAFAAQTDLALSILERGQIVGGCGLHRFHSPNRDAELGYWLAADAQNRGLATRSIAALIDHAFTERQLHRVHLHTLEDNARSQAVADRLGFRREGLLREAILHNGEHRTIVLFGLLAQEWRSP